MTGTAPFARPPGPKFRSEPTMLAFALPAVLAAYLDATGPGTVADTLLLLGGLILLGLPGVRRARVLSVPLGILVVAVPAIGDPGALLPALLCGASGVGLVYWIGHRSEPEAGTRERLGALSWPAFALCIAIATSVAFGGTAGNPAAAGILAVAALLLVAYLLLARSPDARPGGPGAVADPSTG